MYNINLTLLPSNLLEARFIEVGRPLVKVNSSGTRQQKIKRKARNLPKDFLNNIETKALDQSAILASESRIQSLRDLANIH